MANEDPQEACEYAESLMDEAEEALRENLDLLEDSTCQVSLRPAGSCLPPSLPEPSRALSETIKSLIEIKFEILEVD